MKNLNTYTTFATRSTVESVDIAVGMIEGGEADQYKELRKM